MSRLNPIGKLPPLKPKINPEKSRQTSVDENIHSSNTNIEGMGIQSVGVGCLSVKDSITPLDGEGITLKADTVPSIEVPALKSDLLFYNEKPEIFVSVESGDIANEVNQKEVLPTLVFAEMSDTFSNGNDDLSPRSLAESVLYKAIECVQSFQIQRSKATGDSCGYQASVNCEVLLNKIKMMARKQAELIITKDCISRLILAEKFIKELHLFIAQEKNIVQQITTDSTFEITKNYLKIEELQFIIDQLRVHTNHWFHIEKYVDSIDIIKPLSITFKSKLLNFKESFNSFTHHCLWLIWQFLHLKLFIISCLDSSILSDNYVKSIIEIMEKFNCIVDVFQLELSYEECLNELRINSNINYYKSLFIQVMNCFTISELLHIFSEEHSKTGSKLNNELLFQFATTMHLKDIMHLPFHWLPKVRDIQYWPNVNHSSIESDTSDYFSANGNSVAAIFTDASSKEYKRLIDKSFKTDSLINFFSNEELFIAHFVSLFNYCSNIFLCDPHCHKFIKVSHLSSGIKKNITWADKEILTFKPMLVSRYLEQLATIITEITKYSLQSSQMLNHQDSCGSIIFWTSFGTIFLSETAFKLSKTSGENGFILKILHQTAVNLHMQTAFSKWDEKFSEVLIASTDHRCPLVLLSGATLGTKVGKLMSDALEPLLSLLTYFHHSGQGSPFSLAEVSVLPRLEASLSVILFWLNNYIQQFLNNWQISQYLLIIHSDLKHLIDLLKHLSTVKPTTLALSFGNSLAWHYHKYQMPEEWNRVNNIVSQIQNTSSTSIQQFYQSCYQKSAESFSSSMPCGKLWRRKYQSNGPPNQHNTYIDDVITTVLEPVIEGVRHLSMPGQISVLSMATKAFCEAWMDYICTKKIKFSLHGAQLLRLDFSHLTMWLQMSSALSTEAQQSIQALEVLRRLHGSSLLLMRQPKSNQRFRKTRVSPSDSVADFRNDSFKTEESPSALEIQTDEAASFTDSLTDEDFVPNKEEWLALRIHGSTSRWPTLWCLSLHCE